MLGLCALVLAHPRAESQEWIYTVRPGDNLWNLSEEYLSSMRFWRRLQTLNQIDDPTHIPPGTRLRFPVAWLKLQPAGVRVVEARGDVRTKSASSAEPVRLEPRADGAFDLLRGGDEIHTGAESSVVLEFADGSKLLMQSDSHLILDSLSAYGGTGMVDTRVRLQRGRVDSQVNPNRGRSTRYEITTPAASTAVRGTDYRVSTDDRSPPVTRAEVLGGKVRVAAAGKDRLVPEKFGTLAAAGEPPAPPKPLLPAPNISALPVKVDRVPIQMAWAPLNGAMAYRIQIASSETLTTLLFDKRVARAQLTGVDLPDGEYSLRIRGVDADGLEGINADHRFTLDARPEPPLLVSPPPDSTVREAIASFEWSEPENASRYHFQLAGEEDFNSLLVDIPRHDTAQITPDRLLETGQYFWRVATGTTDGEVGPFSDPQSFKIRPAPTGPEMAAAEEGENEMVFRWREGLPGQRYQFQFSTDPEFQEVMVDETVTEPEVRVPKPTRFRTYVRVRTIDVDGYAGAFGTVQHVDPPPWRPWGLLSIPLLLLIFAL